MSRRSGALFDMQFITSCISTMLVLLLLGMVVFFVMTANNLSVYVRENINFSVLLNDDMKETEAIRFQKELEKEPFVKQAVYISKAQALKEQTEAMGTDPAEFLGYNPFTASIEIKLNAAYANSDSLKWIQELSTGTNRYHQPEYTQNQPVSARPGRLADADFVCTDKQYHPTDHLFQKVPDSHHETGRSQLEFYPTSVYGPERMDWYSGCSHRQRLADKYGLHAGQL